MGVINDKGIVGIVEKTSKDFATIQSVLNIKSKINAKIKNSDHFGSLVWDGKNVGFAQLIDVPRLASLRKGDSIVTGGNSDIFPENIPIGKIDKIFIDRKTNYYTINVRLFNDMTALGYVYVIENKKKKLEKDKANYSELLRLWYKDGSVNQERLQNQKDALQFVYSLMDAPMDKIAIENPVGVMSSQYRKPDQIIQPWQFGDSYSKKTCLWLKNLPLLKIIF